MVLRDLVIILIAQDRLLFDTRLRIDYLSLVTFEAVYAREYTREVHIVAIIFLVQTAFIVDAHRAHQRVGPLVLASTVRFSEVLLSQRRLRHHTERLWLVMAGGGWRDEATVEVNSTLYLMLRLLEV